MNSAIGWLALTALLAILGGLVVWRLVKQR